MKWFDLTRLAGWLIRPKTQSIQSIFLFTAYPTWNTKKMLRHRAFVAAQKVKGVTIVFGKFKEKDFKCRECKSSWKGHEEKETDVNIALCLLDMAYKDQFDRAFIISQDSDLGPAVKIVVKNFPAKKFTIITPPGRSHSKELLLACPAGDKAKISVDQLSRSLLPQRVLDKSGKTIAVRPVEYDPP